MEIFDTLEDKIIHIKALASIAICDDKIDEHELNHLISMKRLYGIPDEAFNISDVYQCQKFDDELNELLKGITDKKYKLALLQDLLSCAYSDGNYSEVEKSKLRSICGYLGIEEEKIQEVEALNLDIHNAYKKLALALDFD